MYILYVRRDPFEIGLEFIERSRHKWLIGAFFAALMFQLNPYPVYFIERAKEQ